MDGATRHSIYAMDHNRFIVRADVSQRPYRWARAGGSGGVVVVRAGAGAGTDAGGVVELLLLPLPPKRKRCGLCAR